MSLEAQLWREVGRHLELERARCARIAPMLARALPVDAWSCGGSSATRLRLTTVALARVRRRAAARAARRALRARRRRPRHCSTRSCATAAPCCLAPAKPAPLSRALVPRGPRGLGDRGPAPFDGEPVGVLLLLARRRAALEPRTRRRSRRRCSSRSAWRSRTITALHELARMREALEADRQALLSRLDRQDISETIVGATPGLRDGDGARRAGRAHRRAGADPRRDRLGQGGGRARDPRALARARRARSCASTAARSRPS